MRLLQVLLMVVMATFAAAVAVRPSAILRLPSLQPSRFNHTEFGPPRHPWPAMPLEVDLDDGSLTFLKVWPASTHDPRTIAAFNALTRLYFWLQKEGKDSDPMPSGRFSFEGLDIFLKPVKPRYRIEKGVFADIVLKIEGLWTFYSPAKFTAQIGSHDESLAMFELSW